MNGMALICVLGPLAVVIGFAQPSASRQTDEKQASTDSEQLQAAVSKGHRLGAEERGVTAVKELLDNGLSVNARDRVGWTALMMASLEGLPDVARTLLSRGADPNIRSDRGETALIIASGCFIVRTRADLVQGRGFGPDMRVRQLNAPRTIAEALIRHGADVNAATEDGRTALMSAAMHGWVEVVRALIAANAKLNTKDRDGRLAIDYASPSDVRLLNILRAAGSLK